MKIYRIQHTETGKFSSGGSACTADGKTFGWSNTGKIWTSLAKLNAHLSLYYYYDEKTKDYTQRGKGYPYGKAVICEYELAEPRQEEVMKHEAARGLS